LANSHAPLLIDSTRLFERPTLVIETATTACSVALFEFGQVRAASHAELGRGHAERLIGMIADLPDGGRAARIIVGCGPGSFTGIRVGIAAARALGLGWGVPVAGYSTVALIAARAFANKATLTRLGVVQIGGHGEYFVQRFQREPFAMLSELESLSLDAAARSVDETHFAGSGSATLVAHRGSGLALGGSADARDVMLLPTSFLCDAPAPRYGRGADAKPMQ